MVNGNGHGRLTAPTIMIGIASFTLLGSLFVLHGQALARIDATRTEVLERIEEARREFHDDMERLRSDINSEQRTTNVRLDQVLETVLTVVATQEARGLYRSANPPGTGAGFAEP